MKVAMINLKGQAIMILGLILTTALIILVWNKEPTIYPYLFVAIALASLVTFSIVSYYKGTVGKFSTICLIFVVFLFLRNVQFITTHYGALTAGDVTYEYAVINTFLQQGEIFTIPASNFSNMLTWYSSWPLLHTFSLIFADVSGIKISLLPVILPTIFSLIGFLFVYLITDRLATALKLNKVIVPLSLLFYAISPEAIYFGFKFVRNSLAVVFVLAEFYLIYRYITRRDSRILALVMLNALAIVLTHHYTSFIFTAYLLAFAALTLILALVSGKLRRPSWVAKLPRLWKETVVIGIVGIISAITTFVWWNQVGTIIHGVTGKVIGETKAITISGIKPDVFKAYYPLELTPTWVNLLWVRDFLIYVPVFFGFAWLIREKLKIKAVNSKELGASHFLLLSLVCLGAFFLFELFISHVEPYRIITLGLPFIALCSAILYVEMLSNRRRLKWLTFTVLVFITSSSFLGLWGHRYVPIHFYSSAVNAQEVGEIMPLDDRHYALQQFANEQKLWSLSDRVFSDNNYILYYLLLSPQEYEKIGPTEDELLAELCRCVANDDGLLVVDSDAIFYSHYYTAMELETAKDIRARYRSELEADLNKIYDNTFEIWIR